jgi:hypothetical protein
LTTHGAFLHFITEDWSIENPMNSTAWLNCEHRVFEFTEGSTPEDAHLVETEESAQARGVGQLEDDPHVLADLEGTAH